MSQSGSTTTPDGSEGVDVMSTVQLGRGSDLSQAHGSEVGRRGVHAFGMIGGGRRRDLSLAQNVACDSRGRGEAPKDRRGGKEIQQAGSERNRAEGDKRVREGGRGEGGGKGRG